MIVDLDSLTFDEMDELETIAGVAFDSLGDEGRPKAKLMKALVYISLKRDNPDVTLEEVGAMRFNDIEVTGDAMGSGENPT